MLKLKIENPFKAWIFRCVNECWSTQGSIIRICTLWVLAQYLLFYSKVHVQISRKSHDDSIHIPDFTKRLINTFGIIGSRLQTWNAMYWGCPSKVPNQRGCSARRRGSQWGLQHRVDMISSLLSLVSLLGSMLQDPVTSSTLYFLLIFKF